jgi:hypothetical protein
MLHALRQLCGERVRAGTLRRSIRKQFGDALLSTVSLGAEGFEIVALAVE